jgi:anti-sigma factor RsiW
MTTPLTCEHVRGSLGELATGELRAQTAEEVQAHLATCPVCKQQAAEMTATLQTLRAIKAPVLPDGFDDKLHARLAAAGPPDPAPPPRSAPEAVTVPPPSRRRGLPLPVIIGGLVCAGAIAAALLLSGGGGGVQRRAMPAASANISMSAPSNLLLVFSADAPHAGVEITVTAPPGVRLEGAQKPGELVLRRDLRPGENEIGFAMQGEKPGSYRMLARATIGGVEVTQEIYVQVTQ